MTVRVLARVYIEVRMWQHIAQIALSRIKNLSYHSANPISLSSHAHQISSSSSLASVVVVAWTVAATGWDAPSSLLELFLACDEDTLRFNASDSTPSYFAAVSSRRCVAKAKIDEEILQHFVSVVLTFCCGSHAGCEVPRCAQSRTWVCVGAANSHEVR